MPCVLGRAVCLIVAAFRRYTFPDNCYSETIASHPDIMASMAKAHGMIGKAEPLLYSPHDLCRPCHLAIRQIAVCG